jgi:hypothetical protein
VRGVKSVRLLLLVLLAAPAALAGGPLGANDTPIRTSNYGIDITIGPVLAGARATGLAGAYVAIAEGVDGNSQNPASPAVRNAWSVDHFDYDVGIGLIFPGTLQDDDFFNTGLRQTDLRHSDQQEFTFLSPMANVQLGHWGIGVGFELQRYGLQKRPAAAPGAPEELVRAQISVVRSLLARSLDDGQIVGGIGLDVLALDITDRDDVFTRSGNIFTTRGVAFSGGLLWKPNWQRYRLGLAVRAPVNTPIDSNADRVDQDVVLGDPASPDAIWLPRAVRRPWSADVGVALQLGSRPLNPRWIDPTDQLEQLEAFLEQRAERRAREGNLANTAARDALDEVHLERARRELRARLVRRYRQMSRRYVLIALALRADGRVIDSVGVESFLQGQVNRSGESVTFSPRIGAETEPIAGWLQVRGGSYAEPSRFRTGRTRVHGTLGIDAKLLETSFFGLFEDDAEWKIGAVTDVSKNYFSWGLSLGAWR